MSNYFADIVGNAQLKALIGNHVKNKTLSHAYIIEGPAGSGKRLIAREICKALCCTGKSDRLPCNSCRECKRIDEGLNTDIMTVSRGEKASIMVDDIREMTATLGYYPDDGDCKVYVIEEADRMTPAAQNALLLSLEEPPSYVVFLLLTEDSTSLLETVRSRSQTLKTEIFPTSFVAQWLRSHPKAKGSSDADIASAAAVSRGALGAALSVLCDKSSKSAAISRDAARLVELLCSDSRAEAIVFASTIKYSRAEFEEFFDYALFALRDLIAAKSKSGTTLFYADIEDAANDASRLKMPKLIRIYDALISAKEDITVNNAQIYAVMTTLAAQSV